MSSSVPRGVPIASETPSVAAKVTSARTSLTRITWRSSPRTRSGVRETSRVNSICTPKSASMVKSSVKETE